MIFSLAYLQKESMDHSFFYPIHKEIQVFFSVGCGQTHPDIPRFLQADGRTFSVDW